MVNYYEILKVSPKASNAEIKSAYRRLARRLHPDSEHGSEDTAVRFAAIAEAYEVLGKPRERARYDRQLAEITAAANGDGNGFEAANPIVARWRQMVAEKRYGEIIDRLLEEERREAVAFQKAVFPLAAFFIACFLTTLLKPRLFTESGVIGKLVIVTLFIVALIKLFSRLKDGIERYTVTSEQIHESLLEDDLTEERRYSRLAVGTVLIFLTLGSLAAGLVIGSQVGAAANSFPQMFGTNADAELLFYPPILALFVDVMHSLALKFQE
ncbi:MAG: DnaJ domain-containing protein [Acidobacteriota bacterium]|nr:MAG: DnaJ domain-containing protein [Acidobacteriota bacterium]